MLPWITRNLVYLPIQAIRGERVLEYMDEIRRFHELTYSRKRKIQWQKLISLLKYTYHNNGYYRNLFDERGIDVRDIISPEDFRRVPFLEKDAVRTKARDMRSDFPGRVSMRKTSGSTGIPLKFVKDREATAYMDALMYEVYGWHGIDIGDRQARLWGVPLDRKGGVVTRIKDILLNRARLNAFRLTEQSCADYFFRLKQFKPKFMYGLPSTIIAFIRHVTKTNLDPSILNLQAVISTGEILPDNDRLTIRSVFKCNVVNEYGSTENGIIAFESPDGVMRQMMHNLYIEIIDPESMTPVEPGKTGEIVITELNSYAMPFIRYRVGDMAVQGKPEPDESTQLPSVERIIGRRSELIETPEGNRVAAAILDYTLVAGIRRFKAFQNSVDSLDVMIETDDDFDESSLEKIESKWRDFLGDRIRIDFRIVDRIPPDKSGKLTVLESSLNRSTYSEDNPKD
jgi:phenylacetate-CoA ligase